MGKEMADAKQPLARPPWVRPSGENAWHVFVHIQPGAKHNETAGMAEERLRIRIMAPAVDNKANRALIAFVAKTLDIRPGSIRLAHGGTSRRKILLITSVIEPGWEALCPRGLS